jgi:hypothetical protein
MEVQMIRKILMRLAGHDPLTLHQHGREEQSPIIHLGWMVSVGAFIAGVNWAVGGYVFAGGDTSLAAIGSAVVAGLLGSSLVVIIDRSLIYSIDVHAGGRRALFLPVAFRVALTLGVSSISAFAVVPILLKPELELKSLQLIEEAERSRITELATRYNIPKLQSEEVAVEEKVRIARQAVQVVPTDIKNRLDVAKNCWAAYVRRRAGLVQQGMLAIDARHRLASVAAGCARDQAAGRKLLEEYEKRTKAALLLAENKLREFDQTLVNTRNMMAEKSAQATKIEKRAITPLNSTVQWKLLKTDQGAFIKYLTVVGLLTALELLPLIAKLFAPQSIPGIRIATDFVIARSRHLRRRKAALEEDTIEDKIRSAMTAAMVDALAQPELNAVASRIFTAKIQALVPIEAFQMLMLKIEALELETQSFINRHPSSAQAITEAYNQAIEEFGDALRYAFPYTKPEAGLWRKASKEAA